MTTAAAFFSRFRQPPNLRSSSSSFLHVVIQDCGRYPTIYRASQTIWLGAHIRARMHLQRILQGVRSSTPCISREIACSLAAALESCHLPLGKFVGLMREARLVRGSISQLTNSQFSVSVAQLDSPLSVKTPKATARLDLIELISLLPDSVLATVLELEKNELRDHLIEQISAALSGIPPFDLEVRANSREQRASARPEMCK